MKKKIVFFSSSFWLFLPMILWPIKKQASNITKRNECVFISNKTVNKCHACWCWLKFTHNISDSHSYDFRFIANAENNEKRMKKKNRRKCSILNAKKFIKRKYCSINWELGFHCVWWTNMFSVPQLAVNILFYVNDNNHKKKWVKMKEKLRKLCWNSFVFIFSLEFCQNTQNNEVQDEDKDEAEFSFSHLKRTSVKSVAFISSNVHYS